MHYVYCQEYNTLGITFIIKKSLFDAVDVFESPKLLAVSH